MLFTFAFRLHLDLYNKLLKQMGKTFKLLFLCYHKHSKLTFDWQKFSFAFKSLLQAILRFIKNFAFHTSTSAIYYCLVYLKVLFSFKPSQKATCDDSETQ